MSDVTIRGLPTPAPGAAPKSASSGSAAGAAGKGFDDFLVESLEKVNQLQTEADAGVQRLLTGESDNVAEVLGQIRKSDVAFSLLVEMRNKLLDAYNELKQMRI